MAIAFVVGVFLTAIDQLDVILAGDATTATWVKSGTNFLVPFVVSTSGCSAGDRGAELVRESRAAAR
jgi:hypothetical protein